MHFESISRLKKVLPINYAALEFMKELKKNNKDYMLNDSTIDNMQLFILNYRNSSFIQNEDQKKLPRISKFLKKLIKIGVILRYLGCIIVIFYYIR